MQVNDGIDILLVVVLAESVNKPQDGLTPAFRQTAPLLTNGGAGVEAVIPPNFSGGTREDVNPRLL